MIQMQKKAYKYLQVKHIRMSTVKYKHLLGAFRRKSEVCIVAMQRRQTCAVSRELNTTFTLRVISIKLSSLKISLLFIRINLHLLASYETWFSFDKI